MRVEGGDGEALRLVAALRDLRLVDDAFPELLENASIDDWVVRTGATRDEVCAAWTGIAGSRPLAMPDGATGALPISERAVEVLEAVLFEIARARAVPAVSLESRTGTPLDEWDRLWRLARAMRWELGLGPLPGQLPIAPLPVSDPGPDGVTLSRFRQFGLEIRDASVEGLSFEVGDVRDLILERSRVRDVACRGVRLISSQLRDVDVEVAIHGGAVIDSVFDGVAVAGMLADVRLIGNASTLLDLRRALLVRCRFFECGPGDEILVPDGRDCFVIPTAAATRVLEPVRGRLGEPTFKALHEWLTYDRADYASVSAAMWHEIVGLGGDPDPEVEADALDRLHRVRVASFGSHAVV